jgi:hypothetical protein
MAFMSFNYSGNLVKWGIGREGGFKSVFLGLWRQPGYQAEGNNVVGDFVLEERVNHDIALSSERDKVDRKKRHAADTTHFLFDSIYSLD